MPKVGRRLLIAAVVAVVGALAVASVVSAATTKKLSASKTKLAFNTKTIRAKLPSDRKVTLVMANPSSFPHPVGVRGHGLNKKGKTVNKGGTSRVTVKLKKGTYTFYCPVDGHEAAGMKGKLIVS
jgi:plastocyanin